MFKIIMTNFRLEKIFWIIKKKLKYMILVALVGALAGGMFASYTQTSTYVATISFYVYTNPDYITDTGVNLSTSEISQAKNLLASYMQIIKSNTFLTKVIEEVGLEEYGYTTARLKKSIGSSAVANTAVFNVNVYDSNPMVAMEIANTIGELAPNMIINIVKSGGIEILDKAELPTVPYASTNILLYTILGGAGGFMALACLFLLRGLMDTTVRRKYEIEDLFTIPIIGTVPNIVPKSRKEKVNVRLAKDSPFVIKEAYNDIRTNLLFTTRGEKCPVYAITSADKNEGKSLSAINICTSYAHIDKKVLLIDADMRMSEIAKRLGIEDEKQGLSDYLACITQKANVINVEDNFDVILAGSNSPNPAELLMSPRWNELLEAARKQYDIIIVDLPPVGIVSDGLAISESVTAYILVVREFVTKFDREEMIVRKLEALDAKICGFLYNGISIKSPDYNYKNYGYGYGKGYEN